VATEINQLADPEAACAQRRRTGSRACANPVPRHERMTAFTAENRRAATAAQA